MRGTTRFTVGIFAASIAAPGLGAGLLVAAGAMLPDIDTPTSARIYSISFFWQHNNLLKQMAKCGLAICAISPNLPNV